MAPDDTPTPEDAFAALGNEVRLAILRTLLDATESADPVLSFTEVYDRLDVDSTSRLSYHLDRLSGLFVRRSPDGYALTQAGERVVRAVRAGAYSERPSFEPTTVEGRCPTCEATTLTAAYSDPHLVVRCDACETRVVTYDLPPAESKGGDELAVLRSSDRRRYHEYGMALRGTCPVCGGGTQTAVHHDDDPVAHYCVATCDQCRHRVYAPLEVPLLYHPAVISFYWTHGVDASAITAWDLFDYIGDWELTVVARDPFRCRVTVVHDGDRLRTAIDDSLTVSLPDEPVPEGGD